jgi:hypothetical protein
MMHIHVPVVSARSFSRATVLWMFGIFTTLLLLGLWGRSVSTDELTLQESTEAVMASDLIHQRMTDWLTDGASSAGGLGPEKATIVVHDITSSEEFDVAIEALVDATVAASLAPPDQASSVDVMPALETLRPAIDRAASDAGVPFDSASVIAGLEDSTLASGNVQVLTNGVSEARTLLSRVVAVGLIGLLATGAVAIHTSTDRVGEIRSLLW